MGKKKAGHRNWGPGGKKVPGKHQGDTMDRATRSRVMSNIRGKDTTPERVIARELAAVKLTDYEQHCNDLPGKPDFVFRGTKVVVFVDGDFWHGFRFPLWRHKLSAKWQEKIEKTRARDQRNFAKLRQLGWTVVRLWEHQIERDPHQCAARVRETISKYSGQADPTSKT
ncbi:MAG: very short patch repair endonuclease [Pirellulaceae bacterium]|nr:very short patch repair endonuclease [Pirellulaceae bacterium]